MIEIFVVGCVMTIALFLAVFERKDDHVKGDEVVSTGPGYWTVPDREQKHTGDISSGSSDESDDDESEDHENQKQVIVSAATQDYARVLQLRLHRFGDYRTRKEVNDLLILLVYYYTVIIKILGVLLTNQSREQVTSISQNVPTITLYKEEEEFPLDDELPVSSSKKKSKEEKQAEDVVMPICLRKDDEAMYHEASLDNLDVLIAQRRKIETYISRLSDCDVDIVKDVPASFEDQPSITNDQSDVSFNVSIGKNINEDTYEQLIKKDDNISELESLQAKLGDAKDEVNIELESLKTKFGYDLSPKIKPEISIDESDCSMPPLKSISIDESDFDLSSSQVTESESVVTEVELCPDKSDTFIVDTDSTITIDDRIEKVAKDNDQITVAQEPIYENSYHTGAIPKYSHPDTIKAATNSQTANFSTPVIQVENFKESEKIASDNDSLICESKPIDTQETSKAEIIKLKPIEKDILDGSDDDDIDIDDTEDSDVSIPNMKGSYTLHQEDFGVDEIYEDRDPMAFLVEDNESENDLPETFVDSFFNDESVPCAPVSDTTYHIDPILEEESEEDSSIDEKDVEPPVQLTLPTVTEDKFAMTFSQAVDDDDNIEQSVFQTGDKVTASNIAEEKKHIDDMKPDKNVDSYPNGNMQKDVLHKIKDLADKLDAIKNQELNVDCVIVEDITEDVITVETESQKKIHKDEPYSAKLDQCKDFNIKEDSLEVDVYTEVLKNNEGIESNDVNYLPISENQTFLKEQSIVQKIDENGSLNNIQDLVDKSTADQNEETNTNLNKPLTLSIEGNETNSKETIKNGILSAQENKDFSSELDQSQDFNKNGLIEMINEKIEIADKPIEINDAIESKDIGSVRSNIGMTIESVIQNENDTKAKENIKNGTLPSQANEEFTSELEQSQDFNTNGLIEEINEKIEIADKPIEMNDAIVSKEIGSVRSKIEMAIESVIHDENETNAKEYTKNGTLPSQVNEEFMSELDKSQEINANEPIEMVNGKIEIADKPIEINNAIDSKDIGSIKGNIEMAIESVTNDIHIDDGKSSDENSGVINDINELSVKNSAELPSEVTVQDKKTDGDAISIGNDQRTSSAIEEGFVSDKSELPYSEKDSVISVRKGEEVLLDLSEDQDCSAIDRCEAFSADIEPPEDFVYEGENEYQKTERLENFKNLETLQAAVVSSDECNHKIVLDVHEFRHGDLRVSAVGEAEILVEAVSEVPEHEVKAMQIRKFRQKFLLPDTAAATDSIAALSSDGVLAIITPKKDGTTTSIKRKLPEDVETPEKSSKYMTKNDPRSNETEKSTIIDREMVECFLPILQRGNFFTDSIFQETRQDFNTAITEVLDKWGERSVHDPQRGTQREEPKEDNQVMVITDDDHNTRKILVDIADFTLDGEVKINVMDEELVVEGRTKKAEGGASSVKTFIRRFTLAPDIDPSAVTSVVTPDGILEITTPKKAVIPKLKEFSIQVIIELIVEESRTSPRKDSKTRRKLKDKSPAKDTDSSHSRKKKKVHPEDAKKQDKKQQDAKKQQEQAQELMQQASAGSEDSKNKVLDDMESVEISSINDFKPSDNSVKNDTEEQSASVLKDTTKEKQNKKVKDKSKKGEKLRSSNDTSTKEKDLKHIGELDELAKDTSNGSKAEVLSLNKHEEVVSKQVNEIPKNNEEIQGLENNKNARFESVDESSVVEELNEKCRDVLEKSDEIGSTNKDTSKESKDVEQDELSLNKEHRQSTGDSTQDNKESKDNKKQVTKKSKSKPHENLSQNIENENKKANEDIQEDLKLKTNSAKDNSSSNTQSMPEDLQNVTKDKKQSISKSNNELDINGEISKQEIEGSVQNDTLNKNKDSHQVNEQSKDVEQDKSSLNKEHMQSIDDSTQGNKEIKDNKKKDAKKSKSKPHENVSQNSENEDKKANEDIQEDLKLKTNSAKNNSSSNVQSMPEDLQNGIKDKKQPISKSSNELDIKGEVSKQEIEDSIQNGTLNKDKDSQQVNEQNIEGSNKEGSQKKYENDKQSTDTSKIIDIAKDTSKESQKNTVSSIEQSSVPDGMKDLTDKDEQVVKTANEKIDAISNNKQDNENKTEAEMTAANDLSCKILNEVDSTEGQNQILNSDTLKIQKGIEETNDASNTKPAIHENNSQELNNAATETKENLENNETFQADSNDVKKVNVEKIKDSAAKNKKSQKKKKTKDQSKANAESKQLETKTDDTSDRKHKEHTQTQETAEQIPMQHSKLGETSEVSLQEVSNSSDTERPQENSMPQANENTETVLSENKKQVAAQEVSSSSEPDRAQEKLLQKDEKSEISFAETQKTTEIKEHIQQAEVAESQQSQDNSTLLADNKIQLSSDKAKSLEPQAVSQKESKASDIEGAKEKLTATSECTTEASEASVDNTNKESEGVKPSTKSQPDVQKTDEIANKSTSQELEQKQIAQDEASKLLSSKAEKDASSKSAADEVKSTTAESSTASEVTSTTEQKEPTTAQEKASKLLSSETKKDAPSKSKSTTAQQELAIAESSVAGELKSTAEQQELATAESSAAGELKLTTEQKDLAMAESSAAVNVKSSTEQQELTTAKSSVASELKSTTEQQELATAESSVASELKSTSEQQKLAKTESSVAGNLKSTTEQQESTTAESSAVGELKSTTDQQELATAESSAAVDLKSPTEQHEPVTADSPVAVDLKSPTDQQELASAGSSVADELKSTSEQEKLASNESSVPGNLKSTAEQQESATAESSVVGELKSTTDQQELATADSSVAVDIKSPTDQQELLTADSSVAVDLKSPTDQHEPATADSPIAVDLKSPTDQQEVASAGSSVADELKLTTDKQELASAKITQIKDDSSKTSPADISQQKGKELSKNVSEQSASDESVKSELSSIQQVDKEVKSTVQKSVKEESKKVVSDGSVKPKKSTVSEKQETEAHKSASTAKLDIQSSTSSRRKEEEKTISAKDAKALFQSQSSAATGSTSDLRSTGFGSGLSNTKSKSTSYSVLPGSSSPSSGYLATGTKDIASGSFTFNTTEEYIKKKPPPRNRPFFNLRDFL